MTDVNADDYEWGPGDISTATCKYCGVTGQIRIEWRTELHARPLASFSLAGHQPKVSAKQVSWPWAVCGSCGAESRGQPE
jgi:hypothetical protein